MPHPIKTCAKRIGLFLLRPQQLKTHKINRKMACFNNGLGGSLLNANRGPVLNAH